jgi:hypothetical protein
MRCPWHLGKSGGKSHQGKPRCRLEDNNKIDLTETGLMWLRMGTSGRFLCTW